MSRANPLPAAVAFARVAALGSFTRAAAELGVSPSALSQTVRSLEAGLGVRLLHRTTRRVGLTEHGERFLRQLRPGLAQIEAAFADIEQVRDRPAGRLRVTLPRIVAQRLLPRLPAFRARYPEIVLELAVDAAFADLVRDGFDAGIRLGESLARDVVALPIGGPERLVVVGSPGYFRRHPPPRTPHDLAAHDCIGFRVASGRIRPWEFGRDGRDFQVEVQGPLVANEGEMGHAMAVHGLGLAQVFETVAAVDVAAGRLLRVLDDWQPPFDGFHVYFPAREHMPPKLRAFVDFLRAD